MIDAQFPFPGQRGLEAGHQVQETSGPQLIGILVGIDRRTHSVPLESQGEGQSGDAGPGDGEGAHGCSSSLCEVGFQLTTVLPLTVSIGVWTIGLLLRVGCLPLELRDRRRYGRDIRRDGPTAFGRHFRLATAAPGIGLAGPMASTPL